MTDPTSLISTQDRHWIVAACLAEATARHYPTHGYARGVTHWACVAAAAWAAVSRPDLLPVRGGFLNATGARR